MQQIDIIESYFARGYLPNVYLENPKQHNNMAFQTVECYPVRHLHALINYLQDFVIDNNGYDAKVNFLKNPDKLTDVEKAKIQLIYLNKIANTPDTFPQKISNQCNTTYYKRLIPYYYNIHHGIGRLYPPVISMAQLSGQIRYLLFQNVYYDVDITNAHPTFLYMYAISHNIQVPFLKRYIDNRTACMQEVSREEGIDLKLTKEHILGTQNVIRINNKSNFLIGYHADILQVRNNLWNYYTDDKTSGLYNHLTCNPKFKTNTKNKNKVSLQVLYCFSRESEYLMKLYDYLRTQLHLTGTPQLHHKAMHFSYIPLYDGAYIDFNEDGTDKLICSGYMLEGYLKQFNIQHSPVTFELKDIEKEITYLDEDVFANYLNNTSYKDARGSYKKIDFKLNEETCSKIIAGNKLSSIGEGRCKEFNDFIKRSYHYHWYNIRKEMLKR